MLILTFYIFTFYIFQRYVIYTFICQRALSGCKYITFIANNVD